MNKNLIVKENDMNQTENLPQIQKEKTDVAVKHDLSVIEQVVMQGDLSKLDPTQRVTYYHKVCESLGLNPYTKPFDYISLNGKLQLYARKDATEQLRSIKNISIDGLEGRVVDDLFIVKAKASMPNGRKDESSGAVSIGFLKGDAKANAIMKAETKAKRRVTLSIGGLGFLDETEIETIPMAVKVNVDMKTGDIEEVKPTILTLNDTNKTNRIENDTKTSQSQHDINLIQEPKISFDELEELKTIYALTDDTFKSNCEGHMLREWNISPNNFEDLTKPQFEKVAKWVSLNLNSRKMAANNANS